MINPFHDFKKKKKSNEWDFRVIDFIYGFIFGIAFAVIITLSI